MVHAINTYLINDYLRKLTKALNLQILFISITLLPLIQSCTDEIKTPNQPINIPFDTQRIGTIINTDFEIIEPHLYSFTLRFMYKENDQTDRARVKKLVGESDIDKSGKLIDPGVIIPLKLTLLKLDKRDKQLLFTKETTEHRLYSWGGVSFNKNIADYFMGPGHYIIQVENFNNIPELIDTKIVFAIVRTYQGK